MSENKFNGFSGKKIFFCNKGIWIWKNRLREESLEKRSASLRKRVSSSVWRLGKDSSVFLLMFSETSPALGSGRKKNKGETDISRVIFFSLKRLTSKHLIVSLISERENYHRSWARSLADKSLFSSTDVSNRGGELSRSQDSIPFSTILTMDLIPFKMVPYA